MCILTIVGNSDLTEKVCNNKRTLEGEKNNSFLPGTFELLFIAIHYGQKFRHCSFFSRL